MKVRLWFIEETDKARHYCKLPPERHPVQPDDYIWIPRSLVSHTTKQPNGEHIVDVADWFADKNGL